MVLKMLENYLGDAVMRKGLQSYLADYALGDCFVRQTGVPLVSLDTQCDLTSNQTVVTLKQSPYPNQNLYPEHSMDDSVDARLRRRSHAAQDGRAEGHADAGAGQRLHGCRRGSQRARLLRDEPIVM